MNSTYRILVVGPAWVGDMVMAQSLFMALKQEYKHCQIDVLAPEWTFALIERMPEVRKAIAMPLGHGQLNLGERRTLGKSLRSENYDRSIVLPNSWKSALVPFFANIPLRTGFIGEVRWGLLNDTRKLDKTVLTKTVQRFVSLAPEEHKNEVPEIPQPRLLIDPSSVTEARSHFDITDSGQPVLGLCPGAEYGPAKRWPEAYYAEVAKQFIEKGGQVYLFGSNKDVPVTADINRLSGGKCLDLAGKTSMTEAIDLMSLCNIVISNDSGLMHVAAALNIKLIALYGSSDPRFTPPLHPDAEVITLSLPCSPCFKRECPLEHLDCLNKILPSQVLEALETMTIPQK